MLQGHHSRNCYSQASHHSGPAYNPGLVGFVADKVALAQVFSQYFSFPCHTIYRSTLITIHYPGLVVQ
jgi:hypothetical protein